MTSLNFPPLPDDIADTAASWSARARGGLLSAAQQQELADWRAHDPLHERAWQEINHVWAVSAAIPDVKFQAILQRHAARPQSAVFSRHRRAFGIGLGLASVTGLAYVAVDQRLWMPEVRFRETYASKRGERRNIALPDGSALMINTESALDVSFYDDERVVTLTAGEVYFAVASDKARPFIVNIGETRVRVTGTQFNVRRNEDGVTVSVASGSVEVRSGPWWNRRTDALTKDQAVQVDAELHHHRIVSPNVKVATAWRKGKLIFDSVPLAEVVTELNRYRDGDKAILIRNPAIRGLRIAGVFNLDHPDEFLRVLPTMAPVQVFDFADGRREIAPR